VVTVQVEVFTIKKEKKIILYMNYKIFNYFKMNIKNELLIIKKNN